jgi:hypothetical protein
MNEGLFEKYKRFIIQKQSEKQRVIEILKEISGIDFKEDELVIEKKVISFHVSSVKKSIVLQKNIQIKIEENGFKIK